MPAKGLVRDLKKKPGQALFYDIGNSFGISYIIKKTSARNKQMSNTCIYFRYTQTKLSPKMYVTTLNIQTGHF